MGGFVGASGSAAFGTAPGSPLLGNAGNRALLAGLADAGTSGNWTRVVAVFNGGASQVTATATNAAGEVLLAGYFSGQVLFGSTLLSSAGTNDLFVAKYRPASNTWAWVYRGGGSSTDQAQGLAVSGSAVYVTGYVSNTLSNANAVTLTDNRPATPPAAAVNGTSTSPNPDLLLARYTDNGSDATLNWVQVGGGTSTDQGYSVAVSGAAVYVTGSIFNTIADVNTVRLGSDGTATSNAGLTQVRGTSTGVGPDLLLARYTDNTTSATLAWTQVGGGTSGDAGVGVAASGSTVYVTGYIFNTLADGYAVRFGSDGSASTTTGLTTVRGTSSTTSTDLLLARYTDNVTSATLAWVQVGGGISTDLGYSVAVSGSAVYVTGYITNNLADGATGRFGSDGSATTTTGLTTVRGASSSSSQDVLLARYTDNVTSATLNWTQVGGGTSNDAGYGVAVSGDKVYVTGYLTNTLADGNTARFGSDGSASTTTGLTAVPGASATASQDLLLTRYTDNATSATFDWAQVGGGTGNDAGPSVAVSGQQVYVGGYVVPAATFGSSTIAQPVGGQTLLLARLTDAALTPLPVQLTKFTARPAGPGAPPGAVRLSWVTASELNSARFEVERSLDGVTFGRIGTVAAAGSSATLRRYAYLDDQAPKPLSPQSPTYYRLRQVDLDGTATYSPVRAVAADGRPTLALYPNPAPGAATLTGAEASATVQVLDALGRLVLTATTDESGEARLSLPGGLYLVRVGAAALRLSVQ